MRAEARTTSGEKTSENCWRGAERSRPPRRTSFLLRHHGNNHLAPGVALGPGELRVEHADPAVEARQRRGAGREQGGAGLLEALAADVDGAGPGAARCLALGSGAEQFVDAVEGVLGA